MEREWREAIDMRSSSIALGLVLVSAFLLRTWNLSHGYITPIERSMLDGVLQLVQTGSYRPTALVRPTLPIYLQSMVAAVHFLWGATTGAWRSLSAFGDAQVLGWGRACSAVVGTAVVAVVYQIGMRWGSRHALLAAGLLTVSPMHVVASREMGEGALLTFFSALTLLLSIAASEQRHRGAFIRAGAAAGLAAACHYAGILTLVLPITAAWMTVSDESSRTSRAAGAVLAALAAFLVVTPLAVRDLPAFLNGFGDAASPLFGAGGPANLFEQLVGTLQWPGLVLATAGLILGVTRAVTGPGHTRWTLLVSFPVVYVAAVAWHGGSSDTVLLPVLPAVVLIAAIAVVSGVSQLRRFAIPRAVRTALIATLTVFAILPPSVLSIDLVRQAGREARAHGR